MKQWAPDTYIAHLEELERQGKQVLEKDAAEILVGQLNLHNCFQLRFVRRLDVLVKWK